MCVYTYICVCKPHCVFSITQSCLTVHCPMDYSLTGCPWNFPGKNTGVGCHFLLQGIFLTQGLNPGLLHCRRSLALHADSLTKPPGKPSGRIYSLLFLCLIYSCFIRTWFRQHLLQKVHSALIVWLALLPQAPKFPRHTCQ